MITTNNGWISVKDAMPPNERVVMLLIEVGSEYINGYKIIKSIVDYSGKDIFTLYVLDEYNLGLLPAEIERFPLGLSDLKVTHWMPLPKLPENI